MNVLALLLMMLMQNSTDGSNPSDRAQNEAPGLSTETMPLDEIRQRANAGEYVPVPRSELDKIRTKSQASEQPEFAKNRSRISNALYEATLEGSRITSGEVELRFYENEEHSTASTDDQLTLTPQSRSAIQSGNGSDQSTGGCGTG